MPHCTLPFKGDRYTLIYFINQGYEKINLADKNLISDVSKFPWPQDGRVKKRDYVRQQPYCKPKERHTECHREERKAN
jgi:hypothetical protein